MFQTIFRLTSLLAQPFTIGLTVILNTDQIFGYSSIFLMGPTFASLTPYASFARLFKSGSSQTKQYQLGVVQQLFVIIFLIEQQIQKTPDVKQTYVPYLNVQFIVESRFKFMRKLCQTLREDRNYSLTCFVKCETKQAFDNQNIFSTDTVPIQKT